MLFMNMNLFLGLSILLTMFDHKVPGEHVYLGMTLSEYFPASIVEEVRQLQYTDGDVVLIGYPKSGKITNRHGTFTQRWL